MRRIVSTFVGGVLALVLAGCSPIQDEPLKIGAIAWDGYAPLFVAERIGVFDARSIKLVTMPSSTDVLRLLETGLIDAGAVTLGEALTAISHGTKLRIILIMDYSNGADVLVARPEFRTIASLKGKPIAREPTVIAAVMLSSALAASGLSTTDVKVREIYASDQLKAFSDGKVDAAVSYTPYSKALLAAGGKVLFDSSAIPGTINDVLVVREDAFVSKAKSLLELVRGFYKAETFMQIQPKAARGYVAAKTGTSPESVAETLAGLRLPTAAESMEMLAGEPSKIDLLAQRLAKTMVNSGLLPADFQFAAMGDVRDLNRAME